MTFFDVVRNPRKINIAFSATLENIDLVCKEVRLFLSILNITKDFEIIISLRELLLNAVLHGSNNDSQKIVQCELCVEGFNLITVVRDEGEGFCPGDQPETLPSFQSTNGRGMAIIKHYANEVVYNEKGNEIKLVKNILSLMGAD